MCGWSSEFGKLTFTAMPADPSCLGSGGIKQRDNFNWPIWNIYQILKFEALGICMWKICKRHCLENGQRLNEKKPNKMMSHKREEVIAFGCKF